eukprot:6890389-Pyramimonas_sp.AAC.1
MREAFLSFREAASGDCVAGAPQTAAINIFMPPSRPRSSSAMPTCGRLSACYLQRRRFAPNGRPSPLTSRRRSCRARPLQRV